MNFRLLLSGALVLLLQLSATAQVAINQDEADPDPSAILDVKSTDKGVLVPRMTSAQRGIISNAALGLLVFDTTTETFWFHATSGWTELVTGSGPTSSITDADNDTKIQVEESADEDVIRFDLAGAELLRLTQNDIGSPRLEFMSSGRSYRNILIGDSQTGASMDNSNPDGGSLSSDNIAVGYAALSSNTSGNYNSAIGSDALRENMNGRFNVAVGFQTLLANISGRQNVAMGESSLSSNTIGSSNIGIGGNAGGSNQQGNRNVLIGEHAGSGGFSIHNKSSNVMIGFESGRENQGDANVFLGYQAGRNETGSNRLYIENSNSASPLLYGEFENDLLRINGTLNINDAFSLPTADGSANQQLQTDGAGTLSWVDAPAAGPQTIIVDADNDTKIQVEESADEDVIRFDLAGEERLRLTQNGIGSPRLELVNSSNILIGNVNTGANNTVGSSNTAVGQNALSANANGNLNSAFGEGALRSNISGGRNVALGNEALGSIASSSDNVGVGVRAGLRNNQGLRNVFVGGRAGEGSNVNDDRSFNVMVGYASGFSNQGNANVFLGYQAGQNAAGSNRLYIENSSSNSPLIYGEFDNNLLRINGTLNINNAFSLPSVDGSAGQQLQTDGAGNVAWVDPSVSADDQTIDVLNLNGTTLEISLAGDNQPTRTIDLSALVDPVGTIKMWPTETPPPGWLICDGSLVPNAYPVLQNLLPNQRLPDLRGRVPIGSGTGTAMTSSDYTVGQSGGQEKRTITLEQMPEHSHEVFYREGTESGSSSNAYSELRNPPSDTNSLPSANTTTAGNNEPFDVVQPYYVVNFIIKAE